MPRDQVSESELFVAPVDPVLDVLVKARAWLDDPAHWLQGAYGDFAGTCDGPTCAWGALWKFTLNDSATEFAALSILEGLAGVHVPHFNDAPSTTHADVLALFDRAIASRKAES